MRVFFPVHVSNEYSTSTPTEADIKERSAQYGRWPLQLVSYFLFHKTYKHSFLQRLITGPPIGGGLAASNWRWLFYLNLPLTGIVMIIVAMFVNLKVPKGTMREKLGRMDWTGN